MPDVEHVPVVQEVVKIIAIALAEQHVLDAATPVGQHVLDVQDALIAPHAIQHVLMDVKVAVAAAERHALVAVLMLALVVQIPAAQPVQIIAMVVVMELVQLNVLELV